MGANGVDGEVQIPIKFTVEDDSSVSNYINDLKKKLETVRNLMKTSGNGLDNSTDIQKSIDAMEQYIRKIEDSRAKIVDMQHQMELAKDSLTLAKSDKPFNIGDFKVTQADIDKSVVEAQEALNNARQKYLDQAPEYLRELKTAASMANATATNLDTLTNAINTAADATANARPKVDLFKQSLQQFKGQFREKFNADMGLPQVEKSIDNIKVALQSADNALKSMHKTAGGRMVNVDPGATDELKEQYEVMTDQYTELEFGLQMFEKFKSMIEDGSVTQALRQNGESTEQWVADINNLAKECEEAIPLLMEMAMEYEHIARAAALSATKTDKGVVQSADFTRTGKASDIIGEQNAREKAEAEREAAQKKADEAAEARTKNQIKRINREIAAVKQSAAQYYYKLRAVKMLGFAIKNIDTTVKKFAKNTVNATSRMLAGYLRLIPGVNALRRALDKTHTSQKKLNREMRNSTKSSKGIFSSAKQLLSFMLKYTIGIRSIYVLFNKLRKAVIDGLGSMSQQFDRVNQKMSTIVTNLNYMKASITSVVEPLLNLLAPAIEKLANAFADLTYKVASFFAALTGQSTVLKAIKVQTDYAESLDKTAKSAKNAADELGKYDKLNVIDKNKGDENDFGGMAWEEVPIDDTIKGWADKFKDFFTKLFEPLKTAWEKFRNYFINSWKYAISEIKKLLADIADAFWRVWSSDTVQKIFDNILITLALIGQVVGNLAKQFREAWNENDNGYRILLAIAQCVERITDGLRRMAEYTVQWSSELSFIPLLNSLADNMEQKLVPAVSKVVDLFVILYEQIILKLVKDFIESGLPQMIDILGNIVGTIGNIAENLRIALQSGSNGILIVDRFEQLLQIVADGIEYCAQKTEEWAKNLDFRELMSSLRGFLEDIKPLVQFLTDTFSKFWADVLLPFWQYLAEQGAPEFLREFGDAINNIDWEKATSAMNTFMEALEPFFELAWEVITQIILDLTKAFGDLVESGTLNSVADGFKKWVEDADPESIATTIEHLAIELTGLVAGLNLVSSVALPLITNYMTFRNFISQAYMTKRVSELTAEIAKLHPELAKAAPQVSHFTGIMKTFAGIFAIGGGLVIGIKNFFAMWEEGVTPVKAAIEVLSGAIVGLGLVILGIASWPAIVIGALVGLAVTIVALVHEHWDEIKSFFTDTIPDWWNNTAVPFIQSIPDKIKEFLDKIPEYGKELAYKLGEWLGEMLGKGARFIVDVDAKIKELGAKFRTWWTDTAWPWLKALPGKVWDGIKGIPAKILEMKDEAIKKLGELGTEFNKWWTETALPWITNLPGKIVEGFKNGINSFKESIKSFGQGFFDGFRKGFEDEADIGSPSKEMAKEGEFLVAGVSNGIDTEWVKLQAKITQLTSAMINSFSNVWATISDTAGKAWNTLISNITSNISKLITTITSKLNGNTLLQTGTQLIQGLINSIRTTTNSLMSNVKGHISNIINAFKSGLTSNSLTSVGRNLIEGLKNGLLSSLRSVLDSVRNVCSQIVNTAREAFQIHSPSRVFADIGENLIKGLEVGAEDEADDDILPVDFTENFLDSLTDMRLNAIDIVTSMIDELEDKMSKLTFMENFSNQLNKISAIKVPDIAIGSVLPSNIEFKQSNNQIDEKTLNRTIREAVADVLSEIDFSSNNQPIMLQLDSRTIAEAVWDEDEKRYKQRGSSFSPTFA